MNRKHLHHHKEMIVSFRRRFWISLGLSIPVLLFSAPFMNLLSLSALTFPGSEAIQFVLATIIFVYGG
ncbi:MAG: heavy metal translocating P-type ATPase, partial [Candidatus Paceibacteria bacterium]